MAHERSLSRIARRQEGNHSDGTASQVGGVLGGAIVEATAVPSHLRGIKEDYDIALVGVESQRRKRRHGNMTIREMAIDTKEAMVDVRMSTIDVVARIRDYGLTDTEIREFREELREVDGIAFDALMDGLEESALIVNEMTDRKPTDHQVTGFSRRDLSFRERLRGRIEE